MRVGLICDRTFESHVVFNCFRYAITRIYPEIIDINSYKDLKNVDIVFVPHPHHYAHLHIWAKQIFIEECNNREITLMAFMSERLNYDEQGEQRVYNKMEHKFFLDRFESVNSALFENLYSDEDEKMRVFKGLQEIHKHIIYACDVDDCEQFNLRLFRVALSEYYNRVCTYTPFEHKISQISFCGGRLDPPYIDRNNQLKYLEKNLPCVFRIWEFDSWKDYIHFIGFSKYSISPFGNSNAFNSRFYEALATKSIVIQQVKSNTLKYYDKEASFQNCIFYEDIKEVPNLVREYKTPDYWSELSMENILEEIVKENNLL